MVTIRDIKTICTAPEGINLLVVKVETSEPACTAWAAVPSLTGIWPSRWLWKNICARC